MPTIKDVARLAGVGLGTASRVISGKGPVAPATRERVRKAIAELEFKPSHAARVLLSGASYMVGVYLPAMSGPMAMPMLETIDGELRSAGRSMLLSLGREGEPRRQALDGIEFLFARGCDSVVALHAGLAADDLRLLGARAARVAFVDSDVPGHCLRADHLRGATFAATALVDHGHRRFGMLFQPGMEDRVAAFAAVLQEAGIPSQHLAAMPCAGSGASAWDAAGRMLATGAPFTALFCTSDEIARGAMCRLQEAGLRIPEDVSVLGYDDSELGAHASPRLSSVHVPWRALAANAVRTVLNLSGDMHRPLLQPSAPQLVMRSSVAPAPAVHRRAA